MATAHETHPVVAALLSAEGFPIQPVLVQINPSPTVTPVTCGSNVQVIATVSPESGKSMMGLPTCQLFVGNTVIGSTSMSLLLSNIWVAHFNVVNPYPEAAKVTATFINYGTYTTSTESDVKAFPAPPQLVAATSAGPQQQARITVKSEGDFEGTCTKNDDETTVSAETTGTETAAPRAFLFYLGETDPHYSGLLEKESGNRYSATFPVTADFVNIRVRFGSKTKEERADCVECHGAKH